MQTAILKRRTEKLRINELHLGIKNKLPVIEKILERLHLKFEETAYIGDDVNDVEVMKLVGLSACPADAMQVVKTIADYVCESKGGYGAFRDLAELIIAA